MPFKSSARGAYGPQGQKVIKGPLAPVWVTFSPPASSGVYSYQFIATDDSGDSPTYSVASGSIPTGTTLSSSGLLSGTCTVASTFTFSIRATDANGRFTDTGNLSIVVTLRSPSTYTLSQVNSLGSYVVGDTINISYTGGSQLFNKFNATSVRLVCRGAAGGGVPEVNRVGGSGGYAQGDYSITGNLYCYVGGNGLRGTSQQNLPGGFNGGGNGGGSSSGDGRSGSGGGGTDFRTSDSGTSYTGRVIVAGGGGGANGWSTSSGDQAARGGNGGGANGDNGERGAQNNCGGTTGIGIGGSQSAGGSAGTGSAGGFGFGGNGSYYGSSDPGSPGGGGGWYGGGAGHNGTASPCNGEAGGGGGSGYTTGLTNATMTNGGGGAGSTGDGAPGSAQVVILSIS